MKLLFYTPAFYPSVGGIEAINLILAEEFSKHGFEVVVITSTPGRREEDLKFRFSVGRNPSKAVLWKYYKWCDVYFHSVLSLKGAWPLLLRPKRWIAIHHTCCFHSWDKRPTLISRLKWLCSLFAQNIAVSKAVGEKLGLRSYTVIGNAYDNRLFRCTNLAARSGFCFVGRLVSEKGCMLLLEAYHIYRSRCAKQWPLTIIGEGVEKEKMLAYVRLHGLEDCVFFKGLLTGERLVQELNRAQCLVVPSVCNEAFGIVVLEGMACGCYCLVSDGDGLQEHIGNFGTTFRKGDTNDLAAKLLEQENTQYVPSVKALGEYLSRFTPEQVSRQYIDFVLNGKNLF